MFKNYTKWRLSSLLKDKLIYCISEENKYLQKIVQLKCEPTDSKYLAKELIENQRQEQINWSYEQLTIINYKKGVLLEVIELIKEL